MKNSQFPNHVFFYRLCFIGISKELDPGLGASTGGTPGPGTWDFKLSKWDLGPGTETPKYLSGTRDLGCGTPKVGPGTRDPKIFK